LKRDRSPVHPFV